MNRHGWTCHSAPWIVPVSGPVISQGAVVVRDRTIVAVGPHASLKERFPQALGITHRNCVLTPALVNAHIHLELSHLASLSQGTRPASFTGWITDLLALRDHLGATGPLVTLAAEQAARQQYESGVGVLADIGNTTLGQEMDAVFSGLLLAHKEYLGLAQWTLPKNLARLAEESDAMHLSGHAPYSTHGSLLQALKDRARHHDHVFPIHTAEPAAEAEMLSRGTGELVDFIRERGFWDNSFKPLGRSGSIHYLHELGLIDHRTLCIHAIHVSDEEICILAGEGGKVCLCPGSNDFLATGLAPVRGYLDQGILPALGTDSLASNPELSLWREMALLADQHPQVALGEIFSMATLGGAKALGVETTHGALAPGKTADILCIPLPAAMTTTEDLLAFLVRGGDAIKPARAGG